MMPMRSVLARLLPGVVRDRTSDADPFETLELQARLSRLSQEVRRLDAAGHGRIGTWHHLRAAQEAYERTLDDACRLAGIEIEPGRGVAHRLLAEAALAERGWRW